MVIDSAVFLTVAVPVSLIVGYVHWRQRRHLPVATRAGGVLLLLYILSVISVTMFPLSLGLPCASEAQNQLLPLQAMMTIYTTSEGITDPRVWKNIAGNIVLFLPFGVLVPSLYKTTFGQTVALGCCTSMLIEAVQLLTQRLLCSGRDVSTDDVILNTCGAVLGYVLLRAGTTVLGNGKNQAPTT